MRGPDGTTTLSDPFKMLKGGAQGGLSVPWIFLCCLTEILAEDDGNRLDLDFAIRRECLRLECQRSGGDRWFAGGTGIGEREAAILAGGGEIDEGELRWNGAVRRGGLALLEARKQAQDKLDEAAGKVAKLEMRKARWFKDDEPKAETVAGQHETSTGKTFRELSAAVAAVPTPVEPAMLQPESIQEDSSLKRMGARRKDEGGLEDEGNAAGETDEEARVLDEARAAYDAYMAADEDSAVDEEVMGEKGGGKQQTQKRLQLLHEVRLPDGVVERCQICDAAIPYVGFCGECTGLKLDLPAKGFLQKLWEIAKDGTESAEESDSGKEVAGEQQRRSSRLQAGAQDPNYEEVETDSDDDAVLEPRRAKRGHARSKRSERDRGRRGGGKTRSAGHIRRVPLGVMTLAGMRLDYADDIMGAEADDDLQTAIDESSRVVSGIAKRSRELAGQNMAAPKCGGLLLQPREAVGVTKREDVLALGLVHQCECGEPWGLDAHQRSCRITNETFDKAEDDSENHKIAAPLNTRGLHGERM